MRRFIPILTAVLLAAPSLAAAEGMTPFAQAGRFGLGLGGGTLTNGLSGKLYLSDAMAVQAVVGNRFGFGLGVGADVIFEMPKLWSNADLSINWNIGAGAGATFYSAIGLSGVGIGIAGVGGLGFQVTKFPIEVVAEIRPTLYLGEFGGFFFGGGGSVRWFF